MDHYKFEFSFVYRLQYVKTLSTHGDVKLKLWHLNHLEHILDDSISDCTEFKQSKIVYFCMLGRKKIQLEYIFIGNKE